MKKKTLTGAYQPHSYSPGQQLLNKGYEEVAAKIAQDIVSGIFLRENPISSLESIQKLKQFTSQMPTDSHYPYVLITVKQALLANNGAAIQSIMRGVSYKY